MSHLEMFEQHRKRLVSVAYGMTGSVMDAEDIVQDVYLAWAGVDVATIDSPGAYLTTMTTRRAINLLQSARKRRETYVGPWLPEPMVTDFSVGDPSVAVVEADEFSLAMLTALERLSPIERAVLILRDVFDLDYADIADIVEKTPANCRQIATRARDHVGDPRRSRSDAAVEARLVRHYLEAIAADDVNRLAEVFAADVVLWADGGGHVRAARHPLHGAHRVARHMVGVRPQTPPGTEVRIVKVNGDPGIAAMLGDLCVGVIAFEVHDGAISNIRAVLNPEKLTRVTTARDPRH
jgi:RNA polymerase sigma-70 factor, ECF subfamily